MFAGNRILTILGLTTVSGAAATIYYKDEIFGDKTLTGAEIRYLKSIGFEKEYYFGSLYNWRNNAMISSLVNKFREHANKLQNSEQTKELCLEAIRFDPECIRYVKPEFITAELLKEMSSIRHVKYGDPSFYSFSGYDFQRVQYMEYHDFYKNYMHHCENFNVSDDERKRVMDIAETMFVARDGGSVALPVYIAKNHGFGEEFANRLVIDFEF